MGDPLAPYYDAIYHWKDYPGEVRLLEAFLRERGVAGGALLDVACGTGKHLAHFGPGFSRQGVELSAEMAGIAQQRLPDVPIHVADMRGFKLEERFDVVTCLFSSIGYMLTPEDLALAVRNMADHLKPGGWLVIEPWFFPHQFSEEYVGGDYFDSENLKIARIARSWCEGPIGVMEMHHLIGTPGKVESHVEVLRLSLYTDLEYRTAFEAAGLRVEHDAQGLMGRGLYLCQKAS